MKNLLLVGGLLVSVASFANTVEMAEVLYSLRGEDVSNAQEAAKIYGDLANASTEKGEKANLYFKQSEAVYFIGTQNKDEDEQEKIHENGYELANKAVKLLEGQVDDFEQEETLAKAYFFYGANLGKWAEARGIGSSLGRAGELKDTMNKIIDLGQEDIENYGANRILGRVYFKLPVIAGGSKKKAEKILAEAFENTLSDDADVSVHGLNNLYYAEALEARNKKDQACEILKEFSVQDPETLLDTRIPETALEIEQAKKLMNDYKC